MELRALHNTSGSIADLISKHQDFQNFKVVTQLLVENGYTVYLAGGAVRDALLGKLPHDLDLATNASPEQVEGLFENTVDVGKSFGVIRVRLGTRDSISEFEVATFRTDGPYINGRRPENIIFSSEKEDALRRDFTINALFWDPVNDKIIDYVAGVSDLQSRSLRVVGQAKERFSEDYLRILRALRFSAQTGFEIEIHTKKCIRELAAKAFEVSGERLYEEISKWFERDLDPLKSWQLFEDCGLGSEFRQKVHLRGDVKLSLDLLRNCGFGNKTSTEVKWFQWILWQTQGNLDLDSIMRITEFFKFSKALRSFVLKASQFWLEPSTLDSEPTVRLMCTEFSGAVGFWNYCRLNNEVTSQRPDLIAISEELSKRTVLLKPKERVKFSDLGVELRGDEISAALRASFFKQLRKSTLSSRTPVPAMVFSRILARAVDEVIVIAMITVLLIPAVIHFFRTFVFELSWIQIFLMFCLISVYRVICLWLWGATPGKMLFGLRVIQCSDEADAEASNGESPRFWAALFRVLCDYFSILFGHGYYAFALLRFDRRQFSDLVAGTIVVEASSKFGRADIFPRRIFVFALALFVLIPLTMHEKVTNLARMNLSSEGISIDIQSILAPSLERLAQEKVTR